MRESGGSPTTVSSGERHWLAKTSTGQSRTLAYTMRHSQGGPGQFRAAPTVSRTTMPPQHAPGTRTAHGSDGSQTPPATTVPRFTNRHWQDGKHLHHLRTSVAGIMKAGASMHVVATFTTAKSVMRHIRGLPARGIPLEGPAAAGPRRTRIAKGNSSH